MDTTTSELISELLQALTDDVKTLQGTVAKLPTNVPPDYRTSLEGLTNAVQELRNGSKQTPPAIDLSPITARLDRIEQVSRQRPEYKMSQYVQYGAYAFGLMVLLVVGLGWFGLQWKSERDDYARRYTWADWRLRYLQQAEPQYYQGIEARFKADANGVGQWIEQQEQADATRAAARQAAEQAAALTKQANRLEGKKNKVR